MPRGVNNWTAEDVMRFLKERDFVHNHTRGSHMFYVGRIASALRQVCIPFHAGRAINPRTLQSIIRQSGISKTEWMRY
jgi:predicted RNA binding protein YcfA (HicA-like mRNA interferase family)